LMLAQQGEGLHQAEQLCVVATESRPPDIEREQCSPAASWRRAS
jgi:hypothetical protein